jgi:DNA-binding response OmpR family regulator
MVRILLVEDDKSFGYVLSEYIRLKNYQVSWYETVKDAIKALRETEFDLVILDVNLKGESGYEVAELINKQNPELPFIFLTARDLKIDQLKGYKLGAQEYITKPIDEEILIAKVEAILLRNQHNITAKTELHWQQLHLLVDKRELTVGSEVFQLTERENLLMEILITQPNQLVKRKDILEKLWENQDEFSRNSMDVYISRLRKYLSKSELKIRNVHGKGFIME